MARTTRSRAALIGGGLLAAAAAGTLVATAVLDGGDPEPRGPLGRTQNVALAGFDDCGGVLEYYRSNALRLVGPWGLGGGVFADMAGGAPGDARAAAESGAAAAAPSAGSAAQDTGATSGTGTNVQVAGVDEADLAKLDGGLLLAIDQNRPGLQLSRLEGRRVRPAGRLEIRDWMPQQLLVEGDRALVIGIADVSATAGGQERIAGLPGRAYEVRTRLAEVDVSDPDAPRLVRTLDVDGSVLGARLAGGVVRLAISTPPPELDWKVPEGAQGQDDLRRAAERNRALVRKSGLDDWLPQWRLTDYDAGGSAGTPETGRLTDCDRISSPRDFAGLDTVSLLGFELRGDGMTAPTASSVVAAGGTVYATATSTYVATSGWSVQLPTASGRLLPGRNADRTLVHRFDTEGADSRWVASGEVPGHVLNQFALDEHEGFLRVATTTGNGAAMPVDPGIGDGSVSSDAARPAPPVSSSQVTVLEKAGDTLRRAGSVGGLGRTEQIRSVRFIGDLGYVVTFRQTDPLYTLDLSDPRKPVAAGELKIPGYSGYLHPAGPGRLIGLGQDADADGRTRGLQVSLFDISDPAAPRRLDTAGMPEAYGMAEDDHHAFTLAGDLLLSPYEAWRGDGGYDAGVLALRVGDGSLTAPTALRLTDDAPGARPELSGYERPLRTFVREGAIFSLTTSGVAVHDATSLQRIGYTAY